MRALLVERDVVEREALTLVLRGRGHAVTACATLADALAQQTSNGFPLVLIGELSPAGAVTEFCSRVRRMPQGELPLILLVPRAFGSASAPVAALDAGADDYLPRGFAGPELAMRLMIAERAVAQRAQRALAESSRSSSEAGLRALIEGIPDAIILHRDDRIVLVNRAAIALLGHENAVGLVGENYLDLLHEDDRADEQTKLAGVLQSGSPSPASELRLARRDGTLVEVEESAVPLSLAGQPAVASVLRDLAQRKQLEQRVLLAEHMASLGTLMAGIAHELNNPLSYMLANLHFIQEDLKELESCAPSVALTALKELTAQAGEGAERVQAIVKDLKKFSRVDADADEPTDVVRTLDTAINMAWNEIKHRAQLERRYLPVMPVRGHEARLGQVFLNLLVNAAQAMPIGRASGNKITVAVGMHGDEVLVEISDTGAGMPAAVVKRIFEPFFTTKPVGVGTGLGLSICRDIVTAIGGEISVESAIGKGSTFRVLLQKARHSTVRPRIIPSLPAQANPRALRILVIDDEPNVLKALERALREHEVTSAASGSAALEALEAGDFELVFCDLMMAEVSGMEIYEQVRQKRPGMESSFVFMTGGVFTQQATDFLAAIPNPVVHKPFDLRALRRLVGQRIAA
jgi:PAS domain S-box-containing protein